MIFGNCCGLLLLALGAFAATIETPEENSQQTDSARVPKRNEPEFFFISKLTGLWQAVKDEKGNLKAERRAKYGEKAIAMDYHYEKNLLFWSTYDGQIYSCPMRGRTVQRDQVKLIYSYTDWYPISIAVDYVSDLLYIVDSKANTLSVMALDGSSGTNMIRSFNPVVGEDFKPTYLEVDPYAGVIFLMDNYNAINHLYRINVDGSEPRAIDAENFKRQRRLGAFTLDRFNQRILVSSPMDSAIESISYIGLNLRGVVRVENYASTMAIDHKNSYLYFINITAYAMYSTQEKTTDVMKTNLYRCDYSIPEQKCTRGSIKLIDGEEWSAVLQLKTVGEPFHRIQDNECRRNPCQHLCIYTARRDKFSCKCKTGYRLVSKGRCERIDEFLLFENDNYVGGIDMSAPQPNLHKTHDEVFSPFKISMRPTGDDQFGFDYDPLKERLLYSNNHEVIVKNLRNDKKYSTLLNPSKSYGLLAIDSTSNQFYFVEISENYSNYSIGVSSILDPPYLLDEVDAVPQRTAIKILRSNVGRVRSLAVYPALGYVFYVSYDANSEKFRLVRMMVDGSGFTNMYGDLGTVTYMTLDYTEGKIYYVDEENFIHRADLDGKRAERLTKLPVEGGSPLGCMNGFSVYGDWIYVKDSNDMRRYNKTIRYCPQWERYDPKPFNFDMRTQLRFHSTKTNATIPTPCSDQNIHECQQLCFALPDAKGKLQPQCACDDGFELDPDKKRCTQK